VQELVHLVQPSRAVHRGVQRVGRLERRALDVVVDKPCLLGFWPLERLQEAGIVRHLVRRCRRIAHLPLVDRIGAELKRTAIGVVGKQR
jgi:hypothetical protein